MKPQTVIIIITAGVILSIMFLHIKQINVVLVKVWKRAALIKQCKQHWLMVL